MAHLGIAITTYNRPDLISRQLKLIKTLTKEDYTIVICDDGSDIDLFPLAKQYNAVLIKGDNRGVAWNKNRGLFYLMNYTDANFFIMLDDDIIPTTAAWEQEWINASALYGHVNYALPNDTRGYQRGEATSTFPSISSFLLGVAFSFHRDVIAEIGYMDTRFGRYGHEHTELTLRSLKAGYGGFFDPNPLFFQIEGGLKIIHSESWGDPSAAEENWRTFLNVKDEAIYKNAWRCAEEYKLLMSEMRSAGVKRRGITTEEAQAYMTLYTDVGPTVSHAVAHYLSHGRDEGRVWGLEA